VVCGDTRTSAVFKIEAFDLNDKGDGTPYFRREMTILHKVIPKPGIMVDKILKEFTKDEIEIPYPALSPAMVQALVDELELIGYLKIQKGKASVTKKGEAKLNAFKKGLSAQERKALKM
jgi:ribosomal protein S19E (S16A)